MPDGTDETPTDPPRATQGREWEVFTRESATATLQHAGSVTAPTADVAREQAGKLLGWAADSIWLCPADEVERVQEARLEP